MRSFVYNDQDHGMTEMCLADIDDPDKRGSVDPNVNFETTSDTLSLRHEAFNRCLLCLRETKTT